MRTIIRANDAAISGERRALFDGHTELPVRIEAELLKDMPKLGMGHDARPTAG